MGIEYSPYKSFNCNWSLDQPGMGRPSSWKTKNYLTSSDIMWEGHLHWFYLILHHATKISHINVLAPEIKELNEPIFHQGFNRVSHINKTGTQSTNIGDKFSSLYWNGLHCWVVEIMLFICRSIGSNHCWNLIWASVPYYCFSPPWRGGTFSSPSSDHPQLVHIYENMLCKQAPVSF